MKYSEYIKGKSVAFVGACPDLMYLKKGSYIDSFDVVVKTNGSMFFHGEDYYNNYGSRLDVLYANVQFIREMRPLNISDIDKAGIDWICCKTNDIKDIAKGFDNIRPIRSTMEYVNRYLSGALMGAYIFTDILLQQPKELYITGIDFFLSKKKEFEHDNYKEYLDGYLPDRIREQGNLINAGKKEDGHGVLENTEYINSLFDDYEGIIHTDKTIFNKMKGIVSGELCQI